MTKPVFVLAAAAVALAAVSTSAPAQHPGDAGRDALPFITDQDASQTLVSTLVGMELFSQEREAGDAIGTVSDVVFDADGRVRGLVVGVGGWLGVGEKAVGIPWPRVRDVDADAASASVNLTRRELEQAPAFRTESEQEEIDERHNRHLSTDGPGASRGAG